MLILTCAIFLLVMIHDHQVQGFFFPSIQYSGKDRVILHGVLSKSAILRASKGSTKEKRKEPPGDLNKKFLVDALEEAVYWQFLVGEALKHQEEEQKFSENHHGSEKIRAGDDSKDENVKHATTEKNVRRKNSLMERRKEVNLTTASLQRLIAEVDSIKPATASSDLVRIKNEMVNLGFEVLFRQCPETWKIRRKRSSEFGRPQGFDGLTFYTPLGVPILVGEKGAHKDDTLRRVAQGSDLWFQVEDYSGPRVLLRTSLKRGLRGSKECMQMAANLAAWYSDWSDCGKVPVMYTDSRHVAKRGSKVGQMRQRKSLGRILGHPKEVMDIVREKRIK